MAMEKPTNSACIGSWLVVSVSNARRPQEKASANHESRRSRVVTVSYVVRSIFSAFAAATAARTEACGAAVGDGMAAVSADAGFDGDGLDPAATIGLGTPPCSTGGGGDTP